MSGKPRNFIGITAQQLLGSRTPPHLELLGAGPKTKTYLARAGQNQLVIKKYEDGILYSNAKSALELLTITGVEFAPRLAAKYDITDNSAGYLFLTSQGSHSILDLQPAFDKGSVGVYEGLGRSLAKLHALSGCTLAQLNIGSEVRRLTLQLYEGGFISSSHRNALIARALCPVMAQTSFIHGDCWAHNIRIQLRPKPLFSGFIDFDHAAYGSPLLDTMRLFSRGFDDTEYSDLTGLRAPRNIWSTIVAGYSEVSVFPTTTDIATTAVLLFFLIRTSHYYAELILMSQKPNAKAKRRLSKLLCCINTLLHDSAPVTTITSEYSLK